MQEKEPPKTFVYKQPATTKIFPIDCSGNELAEKAGTNHTKVKCLIMDESPMRSDLEKLILCDDSKKYEPPHDEKKKVPYPVEGKQFLECYIGLAKKRTYKKIFSDEKAKGKRRKFLREFCSNLSIALLPGSSDRNRNKAKENSDPKAFERHVIFGNQTFAREVMESLWGKEFEHRVKTIRRRAKLLPYDQQAAMLKIYLAAMDEWILGLPTAENQKQETAPQKETEVELQEMFAELLVHRVKAGEGRNGLAKYRINNTAFKDEESNTETTMAKEFQKLDARGDNCSVNMLNKIREPYLRDLETMDIPAFEKEYFALYNYLTTVPQDSEQVKAKFVEEMREIGKVALDHCIIADDTWLQHDGVKENHTETMLSTAAVRNVNQYWTLIEQTRDYQMMRLANKTARNIAAGAIRAEIQKLQSVVPEETGTVVTFIFDQIKSCLTAAERSVQNVALVWRAPNDELSLTDISKSFIEYFKIYGRWLGYEENPVGSKDMAEKTAKLFAEKTQDAVKFFERVDQIGFSEKGVKNCFETCVELANSSENEHPFERIFEYIPPLQLGLLSQILHKIAIDSNGDAMSKTLEPLYAKRESQ